MRSGEDAGCPGAGAGLVRDGEPDLERGLGREVVEAQRREQADHGPGVHAGDLGQGGVLRHLAVREGVEPAPDPREPTLTDQSRQRDPGQPVGGQVQGTEEPAGPRKIEDGLLGCLHARSMFHNAGFRQFLPALVSRGTFSRLPVALVTLSRR